MTLYDLFDLSPRPSDKTNRFIYWMLITTVFSSEVIFEVFSCSTGTSVKSYKHDYTCTVCMIITSSRTPAMQNVNINFDHHLHCPSLEKDSSWSSR